MNELSSLFSYKQKSYKMVLVLTYLDITGEQPNRVSLSTVAANFRDYLCQREAEHLSVDPPPKSIGESWSESSPSEIRALLNTPLEALKDVFAVDSGRTEIWLREDFLKQAGANAVKNLREAALAALTEYWQSLEPSSGVSALDNAVVDLRGALLELMSGYPTWKTESFKGHKAHTFMRELESKISVLDFVPSQVKARGSVGQGNWATVPWLALMDTRITSTTQAGVYMCYLFSDDMSRCYLTIARGVTESINKLGRLRAYEQFRKANAYDRRTYQFRLMATDDNIQLSDHGTGRDYEASVIAYIKYEGGSLPSNEQLIEDLRVTVENYQRYVDDILTAKSVNDGDEPYNPSAKELGAKQVKEFINAVGAAIRDKGFYYSRELLSNFLLSLKVRPFVILAGISGTGKSKIVAHVARVFGATRENGRFLLIPVRPDWSDPSDLLGYRDLNGNFVPGPLTDLVRKASDDPANPYFVLVDEMNLARVEYYLSDVLSVIETQRWENGKVVSDPLIPVTGLNDWDNDLYGKLTWPANVMLVGTVNMDETTHSISKKVLDRATTIEFNNVNLEDGLNIKPMSNGTVSNPLSELLKQEYLVLADISDPHRAPLKEVIDNLVKVNSILQRIGAQVGYRVRDVICFFVTYSIRYGLFSEAEAFDIQLMQKILPRLQGSSGSLRRVLFDLLQFCVNKTIPDEPDAYVPWISGGSGDAVYPRSATKIAEMLRRLDEDGFTSYWLG